MNIVRRLPGLQFAACSLVVATAVGAGRRRSLWRVRCLGALVSLVLVTACDGSAPTASSPAVTAVSLVDDSGPPPPFTNDPRFALSWCADPNFTFSLGDAVPDTVPSFPNDPLASALKYGYRLNGEREWLIVPTEAVDGSVASPYGDGWRSFALADATAIRTEGWQLPERVWLDPHTAEVVAAVTADDAMLADSLFPLDGDGVGMHAPFILDGEHVRAICSDDQATIDLIVTAYNADHSGQERSAREVFLALVNSEPTFEAWKAGVIARAEAGPTSS